MPRPVRIPRITRLSPPRHTLRVRSSPALIGRDNIEPGPSTKSVARADAGTSTSGRDPSATTTVELTFTVEATTSISKIAREDWDACACSGADLNPFLLHDFFAALEESGSAARAEGWMPYHLQIKCGGRLAALVPTYLKTHSFGEYVFDQAWARFSVEALQQPYYPKVQSCVPFSPVPGRRVLIHPDFVHDEERVLSAAAQGLAAVADEVGLSSAHVTFLSEKEANAFEALGYQKRVGIQYHFSNRDGAGQPYADFEAYLMDLKQSRRKNVRQEMQSVKKAGLELHRIRGEDVSPRQWDQFFDLYLDTVDKRGGTPYLTREFFHRLGDGDLARRVLLISALESGPGAILDKELIGAALNLRGNTTLYGRNWGCAREVKHLHFAVCYYEGIREAIETGLERVEAGAHGEHKLARGYLPAFTYSVHYLRSPQLRRAVGRFLEEERGDMQYTRDVLMAEASPFKDDRKMWQL